MRNGAKPALWARLLQAAWLKPLIFLALLIVMWDLTIRIFGIPAYQIPTPRDVIITLWQEAPRLVAEAVPTTTATVWGFLLSIAFGIPISMLIAGSRTVEAYVYPLLVFSQSVPKIAIAPLFVVRSEEHTSELQSLMRISYAVFCLKKKNNILNKRRNEIEHNKNNMTT